VIWNHGALDPNARSSASVKVRDSESWSMLWKKLSPNLLDPYVEVFTSMTIFRDITFRK
jgi:hypothetical protein